MNLHLKNVLNLFKPCFRPQQGLTIMNRNAMSHEENGCRRFRPQQGLPIMNTNLEIVENEVVEFPSPTGVTYYE